MPNEQLVRENYRVRVPAVSDVTQYGGYIATSCWKFQTYELEKIERRGIGTRHNCRSCGDVKISF